MRRVLSALEVFIRPLRGLMLRITARLYRAGSVDGFDLVNLSTDGVVVDVLRSRLDGALRLIQEHDQRRLARLRKDLKRFLITDAEGGEFIPAIRACMFSSRFVDGASPDQLAALIVHEGVHARLWAWGIRYSHNLRERIERVCVREEIDFARRLASADNLVADAEARLKRTWWTPERELERRLRQLEQIGRPAWYRRVYRWIWMPR